MRAGKSGILSVHPSPVDTNKIFFRGAGKQHWVTFDQGDHYMPLDAGFTIKELKLHPTEAGAHLTLRAPAAPPDTCPAFAAKPDAPCPSVLPWQTG
jgi:hypothetical protein